MSESSAAVAERRSDSEPRYLPARFGAIEFWDRTGFSLVRRGLDLCGPESDLSVRVPAGLVLKAPQEAVALVRRVLTPE